MWGLKITSTQCIQGLDFRTLQTMRQRNVHNYEEE